MGQGFSVEKVKAMGNEAFMEKRYKRAIILYSKILKHDK
jgi:hypothetical protein